MGGNFDICLFDLWAFKVKPSKKNDLLKKLVAMAMHTKN